MEPASGSGALLLAFAEVAEEAGVAITREFFSHATDIDPLAMKMRFIELAVRKIPATVVLGNSLTLDVREVSHTLQRSDQRAAETMRERVAVTAAIAA